MILIVTSLYLKHIFVVLKVVYSKLCNAVSGVEYFTRNCFNVKIPQIFRSIILYQLLENLQITRIV